jgi:hypothetical protein
VLRGHSRVGAHIVPIESSPDDGEEHGVVADDYGEDPLNIEEAVR